MRNRRRVGLGWLLSLLLMMGPDARACPNCKQAVANQGGPEAQRLADGYSYSILMMIAMPFGLLGTGTFFIARAARRGLLPEI